MAMSMLGAFDVTQEQQNFKNKLSEKGMPATCSLLAPCSHPATLESQIAAHQTQLLKQAAELDELKAALNDALHKVLHRCYVYIQ